MLSLWYEPSYMKARILHKRKQWNKLLTGRTLLVEERKQQKRNFNYHERDWDWWFVKVQIWNYRRPYGPADEFLRKRKSKTRRFYMEHFNGWALRSAVSSFKHWYSPPTNIPPSTIILKLSIHRRCSKKKTGHGLGICIFSPTQPDGEGFA